MSRIQKSEAHFHDEKRGMFQQPGHPEYKKYTAYRKWYSIMKTADDASSWLQPRCQAGASVLDYGCGAGSIAVRLAQMGASVTGIDISPVAIEQSVELAEREGVSDRTSFALGDVEALDYPDDSFDVIWCSGILHHLDVEKAFKEMVRVVKPDGVAVCIEALGHNPLINLYRRRTSYLRSEDEHPLLKHEVDLADGYWGNVERRFAHLAVLMAPPFRRTPAFAPLVKVLDAADSVLLRIPWLKWQAWQVVLLLSEPQKGVHS